jgi:hypothetical protein
MNTHSLSPSFSFLQPFVIGSDNGNHQHFREKEVEHEEKNNHHSRLPDDSYQPSRAARKRDVENVTSTMALQSLVSNKSQSVDIQVKTREGDTVTISFNQSTSSSQSAFQAEQGNSQLSIYQQSSSFESGFSLTIEGDLNEDEKQSLSELFDKMNKVSHEFFNGNVNAAFKHAQKVGFDTEQIAAFSMDLKMKSSVEAIAAYQQVEVPEQTIKTDMIKQARDFLAETKDFMAASKNLLDSFAEPKQSFSNLFAGLGQIHQPKVEDREDHDNEPLFSKVIENIANDLFRDKIELLG